MGLILLVLYVIKCKLMNGGEGQYKRMIVKMKALNTSDSNVNIIIMMKTVSIISNYRCCSEVTDHIRPREDL